MDQKVAVIDQYPFALLVAFDAGGMLALFLKPKADLVGDGLILADVRPRANDKVIGERSNSAQVENFDVGGFLILRGADGCKPSRLFTIVD